MKRFKAQRTYLLLIFILSVLFITGCGGGGAETGHWLAKGERKAITAYSLNGVAGTIDEPTKAIAVTMPFTTNVTALVATFTHTGVGVKIGDVAQTSGTTPNDFTSPVATTVVAGDGTTATYNVIVTVAPNFAKAITVYSFAGFPGFPGIIDEPAKTVAVTLPFGTNVTALTAAFTTTGTGVTVGAAAQTSGATANNFTTPVTYTVTAADSTSVPYNVTVTVAPNSAKAITAYSFAGFPGFAGTINEAAKTIAVNLPTGTNVTALVAAFTTTGTGVTVGAAVQTSTVTENNFTSPAAYIVTAADGTTATYTVTVTVTPSSAKAITAYSFAGFTGAAGTINQAGKTIAVTVPTGTNVTALAATFTTTGTGVKVGTTVQVSTATPNNFTSPVAYIVTAADGTTATYTVTVTVTSASAKAITAYSFAGFTGATGTINESAKTIAVTVPSGTSVAALAATFTTTGTGVKVGTTVQISTATPNNFTSPVAYIVTAANGTTATYTVTVTVASASAKAITAYSFAGFTGATGTINESAKTIAVTVPSGTDVTDLIATFTTTGTGVKVGTAVQTSTSTLNNFTSPVAYIVTAGDGTTATYTVTVTVASTSAKTITAYSFVGHTAYPGTVNEAAKTIGVTLPFGTDVTDLVATFTTTGTIVQIGTTVQTSSGTANDFTTPKAYTVTAADGTTTTTPYTVTVTLAANPAKAITAYEFVGFTAFPGTVNEPAKTIAVTLPFGTVVTNLIAKFTATGPVVNVGTVVQTSIQTANDFTSPVVYIVTAADGTTATYTVTVTFALNTAKAITAYDFVGYSSFAGTIDETAKTIAVTLPFGTDVTALVARFTTTGASVKILTVEQTSGSGGTANNFTTSKAYIVTAADASTATYIVTVTLAANSAKAITAYSFAAYRGAVGTINETLKTILVPVPHATDLTALAATFTTTGASVKVLTVEQTSPTSTNDFTTSPVAYLVTAADGTTATYNVTVLVTNAPNLRTAATFGTFGSGAGVTNEGIYTVIDGDLGTTGVSTKIVAFYDSLGDNYGSPDGKVNGKIYTAPPPPGGAGVGGTAVTKAIADAAAADALTAYNDLAGHPGGIDVSSLGGGAGELGNRTLAPGIYKSAPGTFDITLGNLTLDAGGDANAVWVFQMASALTVGIAGPTGARSVILTNGALAKNVFWQVGSSATINGAGGGTMVGTIIASASVTFSTSGLVTKTTLDGRALALNAAVTMVNTVINVPAP